MAHEQDEPSATHALLARVQAGDPGALQALLADHRRELLRMVALRLDPRLRCRVDASDIVQDAELEVVRRMPDYLRDRRIPLRLWLRQIAYEQLLMARRKHVEAQRRAVHRELPLPARSSLQLARQLIAGGPTPSEDVAAQELARRVRQALARLPEVDREVLLMRSFEGLANQDVAQVLQIEPVAASKRYGRALLRLREALLEAGLRESDR